MFIIMHVHISNIGEHPEPVKNGVRGIANIDSIYLLYSEKIIDKANQAKDDFIRQGYACEIIKVSGFDFQEIVDTIYSIYDKTHDKDTEYSINITSSTNLMAAAVCSTAFFTGAKIYYISYDPHKPNQPLSERVIEVPTPKIPDVAHLKDHEKTIMKYLHENECASNIELAGALGISPQLCGRYVKHLEEMSLVESSVDKGDRRYRSVSLTKEGKMVAGWF